MAVKQVQRILCILSGLTAGGAETFVMKITRVLSATEYQFDFIVSEDGGCYTQEVLNRGGRIYKIPKRTEDFWGAMRGIRTIVRDNGYDKVLKLGNPPIAVLDLIAAKSGGARILAMRSCNALSGLSWKNRAMDALLRPVLNIVANVKIAPSMLAAEYTFGKRTAHKKVHLLHNGVDLYVFHYDQVGRSRVRQELSLENKLVVGHVGRFTRQKNHRYLLEVFAQIRAIREDAALLLVGTGELESSVRERVRELGLEDAVIFAGQRFDIPQLLSAMDVFVFPSFHEGMPNTVIEAQATGLPCVIADTITREADITGLVQYLPLEQPAAFWAERALTALTDQRMDTSQAFLEQGYDIESVARELLRLLGS